MNILIVGKVTSGQTDRLKEEGRARGHRVDNVSSRSLVIDASVASFNPYIKGVGISQYDLVYMLTVGDRKWEWYLAMRYFAKEHNIVVVERKMIDSSKKIFFTPNAELLKQVENGINFPRSVTVMEPRGLGEVLQEFEFPVVLKVGALQRGLGVFRADDLQGLMGIIKKYSDQSVFMIREFIPNDGDIRVFTIGYKAIGAMKRVPPEGDFRSNISRGGRGVPFELASNPEVAAIAEKLSTLNETEIAGVDIIRHKDTGRFYVLEINRGPQFRGLEESTGINVAGKMIEYFESKLAYKKA